MQDGAACGSSSIKVTQHTIKTQILLSQRTGGNLGAWIHLPLRDHSVRGEHTRETESLYHQLLLSNLEFKRWIERESAEIKQQQKKKRERDHLGACFVGFGI